MSKEILINLESKDLDLDNKIIILPDSLKNKLMFIMIKADWCGHCKHTYPKFIEAAKKSLKDDKDIDFAIAEFKNSDDLNKSQKFFEYIGFPHLVLFKNGKKVAEYDGDRSPESFLKFIKKNKN